MEISAFAHKVLFSDSLDEKLAAPPRLVDSVRGAALVGTPEPGRPAGLGPRRNTGRTPLPKAPRFVDDEQRGILLHFFANHELLATELMALALLKFPDAPKAFRSGLAQTLKEEQRHTKWYIERMAQCGVRFGDFPVNRFFWDMIAPMETPLDYVSRLSLTFEQANLDYARHYAGMMRECGDSRTAAILERVYRDEIGHVGYGLKWFRKWKREGESDWKAFERVLCFPMSPSRAKGNGAPYNEEGRLEAGLDNEFIRQLRVFERSRGRTPNVFFFNPNVEASLAGEGGKGKAIRNLEHDLDILPAFLARREDIVLVRDVPSVPERERLRSWGFEIPEFEALSAAGGVKEGSLLRERKVHRACAWGWCDESAGVLGALFPGKELPAQVAVVREIASKAWDVGFRNSLDDSVPGSICRSLEEVRDAAAACGPRDALVKAFFGASARRNRRYSVAAEPWIRRLLDAQGGVVVEPWHERAFDFSVQYEMERKGIRRLGFTRLENTAGGQFVSVEAGPGLLRGLSPEITAFLMRHDEGETEGLMDRTYGRVAAALESALMAASYLGPIGIDAYVYRETDGTLRLRSVAEVNPRFTMGRVAWELRRRVAGRSARFRILRKDAETSPEDAGVLDASGRLMEGRVILNDRERAREYLAVLEVAR